MEITVLDKTTLPEITVCQAARGDYMEEWNGDRSFEEIMSSVEYRATHMENAREYNYYPDLDIETEARLAAFIEKQLSRGHFGPFEHSSITFSVKGVSRVTMAQITRHRHMTFDIQSQRYVDFSDVDAVVPQTLREGDHLARGEGVVQLSENDREAALDQYEEVTAKALDAYEDLVESGVPKEDARFLLPIGTPVNMTMSGNARTMMHVLNLRQKASAQWEIRTLVNELSEYLHEWAPYTWHWWDEHGPMSNSP